MTAIQWDSILDQLDAPRAAVVAVRLADLMGLISRQPGTPIDETTLRHVASVAGRAGIGEHLGSLARVDPHALLAALQASAMPAEETSRLSAILGYQRLAALTGSSEPSLRRYAAGERTAPDTVAERLHFVAMLVAIVSGSFNEFGIRRWFERPRAPLDERAPADLLRGEWTADEAAPRVVAHLAVELLT